MSTTTSSTPPRSPASMLCSGGLGWSSRTTWSSSGLPIGSMSVSTPGTSERSAEAPGPSRAASLAAWLGLERNVVAVSAAVFAMALVEQMGRRCLPKYLETLGAPIIAIGAYGTAEDFLDGIYQ